MLYSPASGEGDLNETTAKKYGIPTSEIFLLDTAYHAYLKTFDSTLYNNQINTHARYFYR